MKEVEMAKARGTKRPQESINHGARKKVTHAVSIDALVAAKSLKTGHIVYTFDQLLKRDARGVSYISSSKQKKFVVHLYVDGVEELSEEVKTAVKGPGVLVYDLVGTGHMETASREFGHSEVSFTARPFAERTLEHALADASLRPPQVTKIFLDLVNGLDTLHKSGQVQRLVKPSNVELDENNGARWMDYASPLHEGEPTFAAEPVPAWEVTAIQTDIFNLGTLVRSVVKRIPQEPGLDFEMLEAVARACMNVDPDWRPTAQRLLEIMAVGSPSRNSVEEDFSEGSIRADIAIRVPDLAIEREVLDGISWAQAHVQQELARPAAFRFRMFDRAGRLHLLGSLAMMRASRLAPRIAMAFLDESDIFGHIGTFVGELDPAWERQLLDESVEADEYDRDPHTPVELRAFLDRDSDHVLSSQIRLAGELRREILEADSWLYTEDVVALLSQWAPGLTNDEVRYMRNTRLLVYVKDHDRNIYPSFQFVRAGLPISRIMQHVPQSAIGGTWPAMLWWYSKMPELDNQTPADWIRSGNDVALFLAAVDRRVDSKQ